MILDSIKIKNFKAVRESGAVKLGPLMIDLSPLHAASRITALLAKASHRRLPFHCFNLSLK